MPLAAQSIALNVGDSARVLVAPSARLTLAGSTGLNDSWLAQSRVALSGPEVGREQPHVRLHSRRAEHCVQTDSKRDERGELLAGAEAFEFRVHETPAIIYVQGIASHSRIATSLRTTASSRGAR